MLPIDKFVSDCISQDDESICAAVLRETHEELGIPPSCVELLGEVGEAEMNLHRTMTVWPFVVRLYHVRPSRCNLTCNVQGFIYPEGGQATAEALSEHDALPSISVASIMRARSRDEVHNVFHLPLSALVSPARLRSSMFRGQRPYWAIDVSDLNGVLPTELVEGQKGEESVDDNEIGPGMNGKLEIWGLTGWYLSLFMQQLRMCQD